MINFVPSFEAKIYSFFRSSIKLMREEINKRVERRITALIFASLILKNSSLARPD
jgi:hypothetical protein